MTAVLWLIFRDPGLNSCICISFNIPICDTMAGISEGGLSINFPISTDMSHMRYKDQTYMILIRSLLVY
jgi:hypothetical protein